jgi:hypothetical protein
MELDRGRYESFASTGYPTWERKFGTSWYRSFLAKKKKMYTCLIPNDFRDQSISLDSSLVVSSIVLPSRHPARLPEARESV